MLSAASGSPMVVYLSQQQELPRDYLENSTVRFLGLDTLKAYDGWPLNCADKKSMMMNSVQ